MCVCDAKPTKHKNNFNLGITSLSVRPSCFYKLFSETKVRLAVSFFVEHLSMKVVAALFLEDDACEVHGHC